MFILNQLSHYKKNTYTQRKWILHSVLQINCWTCTRASWGFSQAIFHARWVSWFNVRETGDLGETRELFAQQSAYEKHQVAIQICFFPLKSDMGPTKQSSLASLFSQQSYSPTYFETLWKHGATKIESTNQQPRDPRGDSLWSQPALEPCMGSAHWRWRRKASRSQRPSSARCCRERWRTKTRHSSWGIIPLNATGSLKCYKRVGSWGYIR